MSEEWCQQLDHHGHAFHQSIVAGHFLVLCLRLQTKEVRDKEVQTIYFTNKTFVGLVATKSDVRK